MINTAESDPVSLTDDENLALLNSDNGSQLAIRSRCKNLRFFFTFERSKFDVFLASMSWVMAAGLIVNAAMGVSEEIWIEKKKIFQFSSSGRTFEFG